MKPTYPESETETTTGGYEPGVPFNTQTPEPSSSGQAEQYQMPDNSALSRTQQANARLAQALATMNQVLRLRQQGTATIEDARAAAATVDLARAALRQSQAEAWQELRAAPQPLMIPLPPPSPPEPEAIRRAQQDVMTLLREYNEQAQAVQELRDAAMPAIQPAAGGIEPAAVPRPAPPTSEALEEAELRLREAAQRLDQAKERLQTLRGTSLALRTPDMSDEDVNNLVQAQTRMDELSREYDEALQRYVNAQRGLGARTDAEAQANIEKAGARFADASKRLSSAQRDVKQFREELALKYSDEDQPALAAPPPAPSQYAAPRTPTTQPAPATAPSPFAPNPFAAPATAPTQPMR
jgi:hypothetical protein